MQSSPSELNSLPKASLESAQKKTLQNINEL